MFRSKAAACLEELEVCSEGSFGLHTWVWLQYRGRSGCIIGLVWMEIILVDIQQVAVYVKNYFEGELPFSAVTLKYFRVFDFILV